MLQQLLDDARDYPATAALSLLWVLVFVLMLAYQAAWGPGLTFGEFILGLGGGHRFGDMTLGELFDGQVWRAVTSTFVHYGVLHIGLNLWALYQLGCLVESWYGPGPFVAIYVVTGGGGNLLSGLVRRALRWDPNVHSGGGSVVVMGLVGLCAVVGWRSKTRLGQYLRNQMVWVLVLTAAIGLALPLFGLPIMDNWGHACGAAVGGVVGLFNRTLTLQVGRRAARWAGWLGAAVLTASAAAQVADDRRETVESRRMAEQARQRLADDDRRLLLIEEVRQLYRTVATPRVILRGMMERTVPATRPGASTAGPAADPSRELYASVVGATLRAFDSLRPALDTGSTAADFRRVRQLLSQSFEDPPSLEELREFDDRIVALREAVHRDRELALSQTLARPN